ncbi:hypothetical protein [Mycobacterium sp. M26]|uniref:hypothetical protein n=1 Tax=Mycobacterium sp. M26 TaxID=1762962 RepID=UPI00073E3855|nr:hypothetical protein [Mycobacterium sp. M26]
MRVFIGSEALAAGVVSRYELCSAYDRLLPDVYAPKGAALALADRTAAAWLWSKRRGVVSGLAAAALHHAKWIDASVPIELIYANNKSPNGVVARQETLIAGEVRRLGEMSVTTAERTAFDLARRGSIVDAVAHLDALARATGFKADDVLAVADRHPHMRGVRRIPRVLDLVDEGAQSPKESWLRVLLIDAGFPRPQTQIPILAPDGYPRYFLDLGWPELKIAVEYDGEQHRTDRIQFRGDVTRAEYIEHLGWRRIRVLAGDRGPEVIRRVERVWPR